ncbi:beta-alanyl-dopamine/carcinine hydrolase-like isoform X2 [Biomphalaria glabrata]|nr:beta-alanyl-dopamine/carcinine hydrolase-like isoform X2 [Biomphalaria glabrata]XP_013091304.2 beta-alanyl-dopamine/carcinine hydrolase-like isoform X2 [Biomphalaria glabrata]XP_055886478.1 beta-alanyl-dopamine/carcinine hydrolase-like isoform X2 [Biomphalaria glabrata]
MSMSQTLPFLYATGTYYEVGFSIGSTFAERINRFWNESEGVSKYDIPFHETSRGQEYFNAALKVCEMNFPQYIQEIKGMADGAKMPFDHLFMLNISKEVQNVLVKVPSVTKEKTGCSDVFLNRPTVKILGHNEDCDPKIKKYGYMVSVRILDEQGVRELESFTSYCYPGVLPGTAVSFNRYGMVFTIDGLYTDYIIETAPPRQFLNRSIIKAHSLDELIELIKNPGFGVAYGFAVNVVDITNPTDFWSIEVGPQANVSLFHVHTIAEEKDSSKPCHYYHINQYKHLNIQETAELKSSKFRTKRTEELPPPNSLHDVLCVLGDQENMEYPIYRTKRSTDKSATALTAIVDVNKNRIDFYTENPSREKAVPLFHLNILDV